MKNIRVIMTPDGKITVEAFGFTDSSCTEATAFLKDLGTVQEEVQKLEYYETPLLEEGVRSDG